MARTIADTMKKKQVEEERDDMIPGYGDILLSGIKEIPFWLGRNTKSLFQSAGKVASDEPELAATAVGTIDDALKRARMDKLAAVDAATAPWTGQKISDLASRGSLGYEPAADIAEGIAGREKRLERDRVSSLMKSYFQAKTNAERKKAGLKPLKDEEF